MEMDNWQRDRVIREQLTEIGRLQAEVERLKAEKSCHAIDAQVDIDTAHNDAIEAALNLINGIDIPTCGVEESDYFAGVEDGRTGFKEFSSRIIRALKR